MKLNILKSPAFSIYSKAFVTFILFAVAFTGEAQPLQKNVIPASPEAASLAKYGTIPVSKYTGTASTSVPIYTLKVGQLELPVSISYHASGIRVTDLASNVGLGWSLNAGGVITRSPKGLPDKVYTNGNHHIIDIKTVGDVANNDFPDVADLTSVIDGQADSEPDIYTFNFNGYSGQFVLDLDDPNLTAYTISNTQGLLIEFDYNDEIFKITTNDGTKYYFEDKESTWAQKPSWLNEAKLNAKSGPNNQRSVTAWKLSKIVSNNNFHEINFDYIPEIINYSTGLEGRKVLGYSGSNPSYYFDVFWESIVSINSQRLANISSSNGFNIDFLSSSDRLDLGGNALELDEIVVRYGQQEFHHELITSYFNSSSQIIQNADEEDLRLRLDEVRLFAESTNPMIYRFTYYGDDSSETDRRLPNRNAVALKDAWGFYNGDESSTIMPEYIDTYQKKTVTVVNSTQCGSGTTTSTTNINYNLSGTDMTPSFPEVTANSLKIVRYPTGGSTEFKFELHDYSSVNNQDLGQNKYGGGLRIKKIINKDTDGSIEREIEYSYNKFSTDFSSEGSLSSGVIFSEPNNITEIEIIEEGPGVSCGYSQMSERSTYLMLNSSPYNPLYDYGGNHLGYSDIKESDGNGYTVYRHNTGQYFPEYHVIQYFYFQSITSSAPSLYEFFVNYEVDFPFSNYIQKDNNERGLLMNEVVKNSSNQIVRRIDNTYTFHDFNVEIWGNEVVLDGSYTNPEFNMSSYFYFPGWSELTQVKETTYSLSGANPVEMVKTYDYDEEDLLISKAEEIGDGDKIVTEYYYPKDFTNTTGFIGDMKNRHVIASPIEIIDYRKPPTGSKNVIGGQIFKYGSGDLSSVPVEVWKLDIQNPLVETSFSKSNSSGSFTINTGQGYRKISEMTYNTDAQLIELEKINDITTSYSWGYNGNYPIAEGTSSSYNQIAFTSFESGSNEGGWTFSVGNEDSQCIADCQDDCEDYAINLCYSSQCNSGCNGNQTCEETQCAPCIEGVTNMCLSNCESSCTSDYINTTQSKTGLNSYSGPSITKSGLPTGHYKVSCWVKKSGGSNGSLTINGSGNTISSSTWQYKEFTLNSITAVTIGSSGVLLDELRLFPQEGQMKSYTYQPLNGLSDIGNENGLVTSYIYDSHGRLASIEDNDQNRVNQHIYNYHQEAIYGLNVESLNFGTVNVGTSSNLGFSIENTHFTPVTINSISYPTGFSGPSGPYTISPGNNQSVTVTFSPLAETNYLGDITLNSSGADGPSSISVSGVGQTTKIIDVKVDGSSITNLSFGNIFEFEGTYLTVQVTNSGSGTLNISGVTISGSSSQNFNSSLNTTISSGASVNMSVAFYDADSGLGYKSATITINSDKTSGNNVFTVNGTVLCNPNVPGSCN